MYPNFGTPKIINFPFGTTGKFIILGVPILKHITVFSILNCKTEQNRKHNGNCNSGDHIAEDHIHMDITTCNIEVPQQKYRLGTVSKRLLGA